MTIEGFLRSLTEQERNFISGLDYGDRKDEHRKALDAVIERNGIIDPVEELWFPYEVIELGKNYLQDGHEREFVACAGIVLLNINEEIDRMNDAETNMNFVIEHFSKLSEVHQKLIQPLLEQAIEKD